LEQRIGDAERSKLSTSLRVYLPFLDLGLTLAMVSLLSTSSVMVFPVSVFTKICIFTGGSALASLDRSALWPNWRLRRREMN